jgi:hypothetical protein
MTPSKQNALGKRNNEMALIASWNQDQDFSIEEPVAVRWHDGTVATMDDYHEHRLDTHTFVTPSAQTIEQHMFPSIVAEAGYDQNLGAWRLSGRGVIPNTLDLTDPYAKDDEIIAELFASPIVYRTNIVR